MQKLALAIAVFFFAIPALADSPHTKADAFIKQNYLVAARASASGMIEFSPQKPTKKQKACIDKVIDGSANKLNIQLKDKEYKTIDALLATSIGQSMHNYNAKVTSISSKEADYIRIIEEQHSRYNNASEKEIKIAQQANKILEKALQKNDQILLRLADDINEQCGIDITQREWD